MGGFKLSVCSLKYFFCVCFVFVLVDGLSSHPATTFFFRFFFTFLFTFVIEQMLLALIITHFNSKVWAKCLDQNLPLSNHNFIKIKSHFLILFYSIFFKKNSFPILKTERPIASCINCYTYTCRKINMK